MKTLGRSLLFTCLALASSTSLLCASVPIMDVQVTTGAGKVVFEGQTNAKGAFSTDKLSPGDYVVQFHSNGRAGGSYAIVVGAGKHTVVAEAVAGSKFAKGGVAMKVALDKTMPLTGQIGSGSVADMKPNTSLPPKMEGRVKFVNGKKYVWIPSSLGSNLGGHWAEAGSPEALTVYSVNAKLFQDVQSRGQTPTTPNAGPGSSGGN